MLSFTDHARKKILEAMEAEGKDDLGLRVTIEGRGPTGMQYGLELIGPEEVKADDLTVDAGDAAHPVEQPRGCAPPAP